jgi:cellulose biosynthesis protein BcsQ
LEHYADICQSFNVGGDVRTSVVAVYSPIGGSGKTTIACALANYLSMMGKKTLYLNFEEVASDGGYFPQSEDKSMSDLMGYIGNNINLGVKLQGIQQTKKENLYYINHFRSPNDIYEITESELEELLAQISNSELYDYVVVDMGGYLDYKTLKIFEIAEKIVLVDRNDMIGKIKMSKFLAQAHIVNEYIYKMMRVINFGRKSNDEISDKIPVVEVIDDIRDIELEKLVNFVAERYMGGLGQHIINS